MTDPGFCFRMKPEPDNGCFRAADWKKTKARKHAVSGCLLEIDEYYEGRKWGNLYFIGSAVGQTEIKQTEREREAGMVPRWIPIDEIKEIFSKHQTYTDTDEM